MRFGLDRFHCISTLWSITIESGGKLVWDPNTEVHLKIHWIQVDGELHIGSEDCPFEQNTRIVFLGKHNLIINVIKVWFGLWRLTSFSTIFQLYRGGQFYWWKKSEYSKKATTWQTSLHNVVSSTPRVSMHRTHHLSGDSNEVCQVVAFFEYSDFFHQ
jgi:hypothetical protein